MQKKASIPLCFSTVLGGKIGGAVPKKGEHSVFFFVFPLRYALQCNTLQCHTIQYSTRQYPICGHSPTLKKSAMSCSVPSLRYPQAIATPPSRGGRSEAQQNAPRQGSALSLTACQTSHNVKKRNAEVNAQLILFFFQGLPFTP